MRTLVWSGGCKCEFTTQYIGMGWVMQADIKDIEQY